MTLYIGDKVACRMHDVNNVTRLSINTSCKGYKPMADDPLCEGAYKAYTRKYPQGWRYYAGDVCPHGMYTGGCGADVMCGPCESGD